LVCVSKTFYCCTKLANPAAAFRLRCSGHPTACYSFYAYYEDAREGSRTATCTVDHANGTHREHRFLNFIFAVAVASPAHVVHMAAVS
jgi:hypothetical protein